MLQEPTILTIGTLLRERYLIKSVLGSGTHGVVYLVNDQQVKRLKYNLFVLKEIAGLDQQDRFQFTLNGVALRQLRHPALPQIHHVFNDDKRGRVYLVMDYIEGANLQTLLQQQPEKHFFWSELQLLLEPLVSALSYLHNQPRPLIHGDVKPINVLQSISEKLVLVDLGYAQVASPTQAPPAFSGVRSPYHPPEAFTGKIGISSDIYEMAATVYTLLTGQAPIDALTRLEQENKKGRDPLILASKISSHIALPLAEVLQQAMSLDMQQRFVSARAFWEELKLAANTPVSRPVTEPPAPEKLPTSPTQENQASKTRRRLSPLLQVAIICAVLLLLCAAGTWIWAATHGYTGTFLGAQGQTTPSAGAASSLSVQPTGTSAPSTPALSSTIDGRPNMLGVYNGHLVPLDEPYISFQLTIQHQEQERVSGTFTAPTYKDDHLKNATFSGTVDTSGKLDITVIGAAGDAILHMFGGLNNSSPYTYSLGGAFQSCQPGKGITCSPGGDPHAGSWTMEREPAS